ncbi:MAG TPA: helix-turn-helix domain-containing protein [Solirubrobacterales bacterium]|nr:helix-turn-helix domain-containing protein [Solirubrobacterales bacterium]
MKDPISIPEAASVLGLSAGRVHAMVTHGGLPAVKVGGRWLIERGDVERRRRQPPLKGRPFAAHNAWALLRLASGEDPEGIDPVSRSRLRRALRLEGLEGLGQRLSRRADSRFFDAHPGEIPYLMADRRFVPSGVSAAAMHELDLISGSEADGYVRAGALRSFENDHALRPSAERSNVRLRVVPDSAWRLMPKGGRSAPLAAVAIDLAEDADPRSAAAGHELLKALRSP